MIGLTIRADTWLFPPPKESPLWRRWPKLYGKKFISPREPEPIKVLQETTLVPLDSKWFQLKQEEDKSWYLEPKYTWIGRTKVDETIAVASDIVAHCHRVFGERKMKAEDILDWLCREYRATELSEVVAAKWLIYSYFLYATPNLKFPYGYIRVGQNYGDYRHRSKENHMIYLYLQRRIRWHR